VKKAKFVMLQAKTKEYAKRSRRVADKQWGHQSQVRPKNMTPANPPNSSKSQRKRNDISTTGNGHGTVVTK
jgi:hypothetical protein